MCTSVREYHDEVHGHLKHYAEALLHYFAMLYKNYKNERNGHLVWLWNLQLLICHERKAMVYIEATKCLSGWPGDEMVGTRERSS